MTSIALSSARVSSRISAEGLEVTPWTSFDGSGRLYYNVQYDLAILRFFQLPAADQTPEKWLERRAILVCRTTLGALSEACHISRCRAADASRSAARILQLQIIVPRASAARIV